MAGALSERQFGEYTMRYSPPDMDMPRHTILVTHPDKGTMTTQGRYIGSMTWHPTSHEVTAVHVDERFQRQGVASEMWRFGQELRPRPKHSPDRTNAGDAWARSVGGRLPRRLMNNMRGDE